MFTVPFLYNSILLLALSIFFCSIFLTLQHFWKTPFDKGQLYQTHTSVSLSLSFPGSHPSWSPSPPVLI